MKCKENIQEEDKRNLETVIKGRTSSVLANRNSTKVKFMKKQREKKNLL